MSGKATKTLLIAYFQEAMAIGFLAGLFQTPAENFHDSEEVEIDIERSDESIATVITDLSTGSNVNNFDGYTNKAFKPPVYSESGSVNSFDLLSREAGDNPFENRAYMAKALIRAMKIFRRLEGKVRRAVEQQAAQVLQTGTLTLVDGKGNGAYTLDFKPKATHFPTAGTTWGQVGATPVSDLKALAEVIRTDGLSNPDTLIFGEKAFDEFLKDSEVQTLLDNRRMNLGAVAPEMRGMGATYQGYIWLGSYRFDMWTYNARYNAPVTKASTRYVDTGKVIMLDRMARFDLSFGSIPLLMRSAARIPGLPERMNNREAGFGMTTNSWVNNEGTNLNVSAGTRPLCIPTAIDKYGALDTGLTE